MKNVGRWILSISGKLCRLSKGLTIGLTHLKDKVITPAINEINERTEFNLSWEKARTYKNEVKELAFTWTEKEGSTTTSKPKSTRAKKASTTDAPSAITAKATNYLKSAEFFERQKWAQKAVEARLP